MARKAANARARKTALRAWSWAQSERIDAAFFERRIATALALRERLAVPSDGVRLVHGEADGLPGLVVDRYGPASVFQCLTLGMARNADWIREALTAIKSVPSEPTNDPMAIYRLGPAT